MLGAAGLEDRQGRQALRRQDLRHRADAGSAAASSADRIGSILINPGGPGGSGFDYVAYLRAQAHRPDLPKFDIIGFDPRGVGRSAPVECISDKDLDASFGYEPDPVNRRRVPGRGGDSTGTWPTAAAPSTARALALFSTEQAAQDMDAIRTALGEEKLNYLGFSYGTLLGAVYAELFPTKIRAMVLDGAVDPTAGPDAGLRGPGHGLRAGLHQLRRLVQGQHQRLPDRRRPARRHHQRDRLGPDEPGQGQRRPGRHIGLGVLRAWSPRSTPRTPGRTWPRPSTT